jgi:hypothetical protein
MTLGLSQFGARVGRLGLWYVNRGEEERRIGR